MTVAVLDAGALIAIECNSRLINVVIAELLAREATLHIPSTVLAQVWRDGARQARIGRLRRLERVTSAALDDTAAMAVGQLLARTGTRDVVDAHVVIEARRTKAIAVITSDPDDLRALDASLRLVVV